MDKTSLAGMAIAAIALTISSLGAVQAQQSTANKLTTAQVSALSSRIGLPVVQSAAPIPAAEFDSAQPSSRLREVQSAASAAGMTWEKVYRIEPASADAPVTTVADARRMVDQPGRVTLTLNDVPASNAIKSIARSDDAAVHLGDTLRMGDIDVDLTGAAVPDAIADVARRTHTHWSAEYVIGPAETGAHTPLAYGAKPRMTQQQYEETQLFNGPVTIQVAPPPPAPKVTVPTPAEKAETASAATGTTAAPNGAAANPSRPYAAPYSPYESYGMYPYGTNYAPRYPYGAEPYQISPGLTVQPGNPWTGSTLVFGGSNGPY